MEGSGIDSLITSMTSGFTTMAGDALDGIGSVVPVVLPILAAIIVVGIVIKVVRRIVGR